MGMDEGLPDTAQALSVLEKALRDAIAIAPLEEVLQRVTVMFPRTRVEIGAGEERPHSRVQKVSVSMPEELVTAVRERTGPGGFSRYVTDAVEEQLQQDMLDDLAKWLVTTYGTPPAEYMEWAQRVWRSFDEQ